MLTRKQRWRRVRGGRLVEPCPSPSPSATDTPAICPAGRQRRPHPINSLSIGDSLLHLLGSSSAGGESSEAACESEAAAAVESSPKKPPSRVHFNHQVRVVLVPCRTELGGLKADIWWGEDDYLDFRREYILAVRAKMAGMGDIDDPPSSSADDTTTTETNAETKIGDPGPASAGAEHDDYNVCGGAPMRRNRCHESSPPTAHVDPSRAATPLAREAPLMLLSLTPPPPSPTGEAPKTPTFSCAFSTPDGTSATGGKTSRESESESDGNPAEDVPGDGSDPAEDVPGDGSGEEVSVGANGGGGTTVVSSIISRDDLAAAAAVVGTAMGTVETSVRGRGIVEKGDETAEVAPQPTQPPSLRSSCSSCCSCSSCSSASHSSYSHSGSSPCSAERAAEHFLHGAAEDSTEDSAEQFAERCCTADGIDNDTAKDDDEEEEGYRTQSTSSVSDHTDAESDSDTDEGEYRPKQFESGVVRKNGERPPRPPSSFRRELPVQN